MNRYLSLDEVEAARAKLEASLDQPSVARVYDYLIGGGNNYAVDREFAKQQLAVFPGIATSLIANRQFLGRAVRYAVAQGVRQFVDMGSGLPSSGNVHEVADHAAPGQSRVVYVDNEPISHAHATVLLANTADTSRHHALQGDFHDHEALWQRITDTGAIDPTRPVCLLAVALLHFMPPDTHPERALAYYRRQLAPGSLLVVSHGCNDRDEDSVREVVDNYQQTTNQAYMRSRGEVTELLGDWTPVDPGLVWLAEWQPEDPIEDDPAASRILAAVARKPEAAQH